MPKTHHLKTLPVYFDAVRRGDKTFEIRKNDRDFQTGDTLVLEECNVSTPHAPRGPGQPPLTREELGYTGAEIVVTVCYCLHGPAFGLEAGHVVMAIGSPDDVKADEFPEHPMQDADGWIEWAGGAPTPLVPYETYVEYRTRSGATSVAQVGALRWSRTREGAGDIIAYRIPRNPKTPSERLEAMRSLNAEGD